MFVYGVGFNSNEQKVKQQNSMGIPLQPVETCISLGWSIPSQGSIAQCLCVFYHKGLSTCSSIAFHLQLNSLIEVTTEVFSHFLWQYFLVLVGMTTSSVRVTLLHPFPTFWLLSGPNGMHADSLTGCSTSSQSVLPPALHNIMPIKAVSLSMS